MMSRPWKKVVVVRGLALLCMVLSGCVAAPTADVAGTWTGTLTYTSGPASGFSFPIVLHLTQDGTLVGGTVTLGSHADLTYDLPVVHGRARAGGLILVARGTNPWLADEPAIEITLDGDVESPTRLAGVGTHGIDQTLYSFTWNADRVEHGTDP